MAENVVVTCINGHKVNLNPAKHKHRDKYCPECKAVVATRKGAKN